MRMSHRIAGTAAILVLVMMVGSACLMQPTPTPIPQAGNMVWVEWENRTEETYHLTITHGAGQVAWAEVQPCMRHGMGMAVDGPFSIGVAPWDRDMADPGRQVADQSDWEAAGEEFMLVIIDEDGLTLDTTPEHRARERTCP